MTLCYYYWQLKKSSENHYIKKKSYNSVYKQHNNKLFNSEMFDLCKEQYILASSGRKSRLHRDG
jgi:hypothetical protein